MGNVPPYAAYAHGDGAGVGIPINERTEALSTNVHVDAAHHHHIGAGAEHVALPGDKALLHEIGNMNGHGGTGDTGLLGQLLLRDHGIFLNPPQNLTFTLGHCFTSIKKSLYSVI